MKTRTQRADQSAFKAGVNMTQAGKKKAPKPPAKNPNTDFKRNKFNAWPNSYAKR